MEAWRGRGGVGVWCFNKTCSWDFGAIILTYWNLLTILHVVSKAARRKEGRNEKRGQMCISHGNAPATAVYLSSLEKGRQQTHWSMLYIPPRSRREMGEVFLSMPQWGKGARATGGYMERKVDELTVIVKKGRVRRSIRKERVELIIEDTPPPFKILILYLQQTQFELFYYNKTYSKTS